MKKYFYLLFILLLVKTSVLSQTGGDNVYKFLSIPTSARATTLGGTYNSIYDNDASLAFQNPATLNTKMHKNLSLSYIPYFGGTTFGNFNYIHKFKPATFQFGATYINYGKLEEYDEFGTQTGLTTANEVMLQVGAGRSYKGKYKFGANSKFIVSQLGDYTSVGMAFDIAAMWTDSAHNVNVSLNISNLGFQFKPYRKGNQELLPVDVQLSFSHRLKHVPFRFIVTAHKLYQWDIRYDNPNVQQQSSSLFDEEKEVKPAVKVIDNIARHLIFGGEIYIGKVVTLGLAYNHLRRAELAIPAFGGLAGFSFGAGVQINRFKIEYGFAKYALPSSINHITLNIDLGKSIKYKRKKKPSKKDVSI
ncbi:MAG: type IX secretion system protein PorQ [Chitinophagales bacterium]